MKHQLYGGEGCAGNYGSRNMAPSENEANDSRLDFDMKYPGIYSEWKVTSAAVNGL
jgi:hypothetical protein